MTHPGISDEVLRKQYNWGYIGKMNYRYDIR